MFYLRRTLGVMACLCWTVPACAFTFSYGSLFAVKDVQVKNGVLLLPRTSRKYTNVRVLSRPVYEQLLQCQKDCSYPVTEKQFSSADYRRAGASGSMLIVQVQFNQDIQLTVLAFKEKGNISLRMPPAIVFKDKDLERRVRQYVTELAEQTL